jgi:hypothetical protein
MKTRVSVDGSNTMIIYPYVVPMEIWSLRNGMDGFPISTMTFQLPKVLTFMILSSRNLMIGTTPTLRSSNTHRGWAILTNELLITLSIAKIDTQDSGNPQLKDSDCDRWLIAMMEQMYDQSPSLELIALLLCYRSASCLTAFGVIVSFVKI